MAFIGNYFQFSLNDFVVSEIPHRFVATKLIQACCMLHVVATKFMSLHIYSTLSLMTIKLLLFNI